MKNFFKYLFVLLLFINPCYAIDYSTAVSNAKTAFLIQSGIQDNINKFGQWGMTQLKYYGVENEFGALAFSYRVYRDKSAGFNLGKGARLTVNLNSVSIKFPINWK